MKIWFLFAAAVHCFCVVNKINYLVVRGYDILYISRSLNHFLQEPPLSSFTSVY